MLSLIICSRTPRISEELEKNIVETIGCEYELVVIDNSKNKYSIFSAYNEGVRRSKGDILCFMHDDIRSRTQEWGNIISNYFRNDNIGCVGIAGTKYFPRIPASWFSMKDEIINVIQYYNAKDKAVYVNKGFSDNTACKVIAIDGVWMSIRRSLFDKIRFDEKYGGFHAYDTDICMQITREKKDIMVVPDILIEHFSCGSLSKVWFDANLMFFDKWKHSLPIKVSEYKLSRQYKANIWWYFLSVIKQMELYSYAPVVIRKYVRTIFWRLPIVVNGAIVKILGYYVKSLCKRKS